MKYPSHGYRWLNAKIRLDTGLNVSDPYAHKCCRIAGIKSRSKHYRYDRMTYISGLHELIELKKQHSFVNAPVSAPRSLPEALPVFGNSKHNT